MPFPGSTIRRYDTNPKIYPEDVVNEVHADGEILAGAWWDTHLNMGQPMDSIMLRFAESSKLFSNGLDLGDTYRGILLEALLADDDDGDLTNGSPNMTAFLDGFAAHGITLLTGSIIIHQEMTEVAANTPIDIDAEFLAGFSLIYDYADRLDLTFRVNNGAWQTQPMIQGASSTSFSQALGSHPAGTVIEYYLSAIDIFGNEAITSPNGATGYVAGESNVPHSILVGFTQIESEDFENGNGGWTVNQEGTDDASAGIWTNVDPNPTFVVDNDNIIILSTIVQPDNDHSPNGTNCFVTGNSNATNISFNDVKNGSTTLYSPVYDLSSYQIPAISYWRWFTNETGSNPKEDFWEVYITNDGTNWVLVERTLFPDRSWRKVVLRVQDFVAPNSTVQLKFVASDPDDPTDMTGQNGASIVEAAVDDVEIHDVLGSVGTNNPELTSVFAVFPNPVSDVVSLRIMDAELRQYTLQLFDSFGRQMDQWIIDDGQWELNYSTHHLAEGVYHLTLQTEGKQLTKKLVVIR